MNAPLTRVFWSLVVHIGFLAVAVGLIYLLGSGEGALAETVRSQYADDPATLEDIRSAAVWQLVDWATLALAASWILSSLWILIAERQRPTTPAEGASKRGLWVVFLLLCLFAMAGIGWLRVWRNHVETDLAGATVTGGMLTVGLLVLLAFFVATAVSVKTVMRPSVPFSNLLPSFSKGKA